MSSVTFRLVLIVSCAHAMVHTYELSLPSVEQNIADEFYGDDIQAGRFFSGFLQNSWRLLWGLGALVAGLLVDRFGSRSMLAVYLLGCGVACVIAGMTSTPTQLVLIMILMGAFAAIYHPAGLALISHETNAETRPKALGIHGILGSLGIGMAPMAASFMLAGGLTWRQYYWSLAVPGVALGLYFLFTSLRNTSAKKQSEEQGLTKQTPTDEHVDWQSFRILIVFSFLQGFVYSALMSFLTRFLSKTEIEIFSTEENTGKLLTSGVLLIGCVGQFLAGWFARPKILEKQLALITFANVPFLVWMAFAGTWDRVVAAGILALVHFMQQPVYNSLIAKYTPTKNRSFCYGISFAMAFGLGSFGAIFGGSTDNERLLYGVLAILAALGGTIGLVLWQRNRSKIDD